MTKPTHRFYYFGGNGLHLFRLKQLTTLHHVASSLQYDCDSLYLVQQHLLQMKDPPTDLNTVMEWRRALDPTFDADQGEREPPDCWEDDCDQ